ncbi:MAG: hypothetical protein K8T89_01680 [Planctomycetes bacterium]|nr:hypothetical protein [Planctomycetota bacterium]
MIQARLLLVSLTIWIGCLTPAQAEDPAVKRASASTPALNKHIPRPLPVDMAAVPAKTREAITKVMKAPTITAAAPEEEFTTTADLYGWLLEHPDRVCLAWQRLNIAAIDIRAQAEGKFSWKDEHGSEMNWSTVAKNGEGRIWFAEGKIRPGALLPMVAVKAVAVLHHTLKIDDIGQTVIRHQVEIYLQTDSKAAVLVTKLLGPAAPRMAEDGSEQLMLFFSGIARYLDRHPEKTRALLAEKK